MIGRLWAAGEAPYADGLYRPDDTARELWVPGPGAWHPDAGQPITFRLGGPLDVARTVAEAGGTELDRYFESRLPADSGWLAGGGGGMGNVGWLARLDADRALRWVAFMWSSNPFTGVRVRGTRAVFRNDWRNELTLDLDDPALR
ncbi:hypothetical protein RM844_01860 [Streptomyces sp. DSM 44915]|uniref:Uncharacterized protein n=1 Tax=Streptomyces chisholmiae TaxID=3075540 RepID=A0ABU2JL98_9ACTN|nr:hypothetical protein [Streptomyces sp. DSM 44915]MDT0265028.1 hypothetical protein [Streptomyces sp. DSM 44915]